MDAPSVSAARHLRDVLSLAIAHDPARRAVVVYDARSELSRIVAEAYRVCLPAALHIDFDAVTPEAVQAAFAPLGPGDLVVLVQSTSFRLEAFRIRVELFKRGLAVVEHPHLGRMLPAEYGAYLDSLAYDPAYYRGVGAKLKARIDAAAGAILDTGGAQLVYAGPFEAAKLNVGDYTGMTNVGGQFPIGEVFTEPQDLTRVSGRVRIFVFGDTEFCVNVPEVPITLVVEGGQVVAAEGSTPAFDAVLAQIRAEEPVWLRELGFGMNRAFTRERTVTDIGTYERMCGVHLSLGAKHNIYNKPGMKRGTTRFHVDVFAATERVLLDGEVVYRDGAWCV